jgi:hypothetical protein
MKKGVFIIVVLLLLLPFLNIYSQILVYENSSYLLNGADEFYKQELNFFLIYNRNDQSYSYFKEKLENPLNWSIRKKDLSSLIQIYNIYVDTLEPKSIRNRVQTLLIGGDSSKYPNTFTIIMRLNEIIDDNITVDFSFPGSNNKFTFSLKLTPYKDKTFNYLQLKKKDFGFKRLGENTSKYTLDYLLDMNVMELELNDFRKPVLMNFNFGFNSKGVLANKDDIKNGAQTGVNLGFNTMYFFYDNLIYEASLSGGYQVETKSDISNGKYFSIVNKSARLSAMAEIPFTSLPFYYLHRATGYFRRAMPLTLNFEYYPDGKDLDGNTTPSRYDFNIKYEGAFSKFMILKTAYNYSKFINTDISLINSADCFTISYGLELSVLGDLVPILKSIIKTDNDTKDANYLYFKVENGKKPPLFQSGNQQSLGLTLYF